MYRRFRQHVGKQALKTKTVIVRVVFYCLFTLVFAVLSFGNSKLLLGWFAGVLTGVPIAYVGYKLTQFENTPSGRFFTPNPWLGMTMSLIFIGRLAYRMAMIYGMSDGGTPYPSTLQSPLTLYVFELVASYFAAYYTWVLIRCHSEPLPTGVPETQP